MGAAAMGWGNNDLPHRGVDSPQGRYLEVSVSAVSSTSSPACTKGAVAVADSGAEDVDTGACACDRQDGASDLQAEVERLRKRLAEAERRASLAEQRLSMWEDLTSKLAVVLMLGPEMLEFCKRTLMKELTRALKNLPMVDEVNNLQCSFPAVPSEAPRAKLAHWPGDFSEPMEWDVQWATASWSVTLSVSGRLYGLRFTMDLRLHRFAVNGRMRVKLPCGNFGDFSEVCLSFVELPDVDFSVDCKVICGMVPVPVQSQVDAQVRASFMKVLRDEIIEPQRLLLRVASMRPKSRLTEDDVQQAILDAEMTKRMLDEGKALRVLWT